jgi:hypothetical protein
MVEYAILSAESAVRIVRGFTGQLRPETVLPVLAVLVLVWMVWRTLRPR